MNGNAKLSAAIATYCAGRGNRPSDGPALVNRGRAILFASLMLGMGSAAFAVEDSSQSSSVQEIIVTAQKREERLQDVPVPVTVIDTATLVEHNQTRLQDYFAEIPGLSLRPNGDGTTILVIRGISTATYSNPTVAVTIDDIPFGSSSAIANGQLIQPDLDPADLSRIEVLRGPQGTLYGASSLGGLLKYVTSDPSTAGYAGRIETDVNGTQHGSVGYGVRGSVNIPVSDTVALRASGFSRLTPGYVEDVQTGQDNVNRIDVAGGHLSLLWSPSTLFSVKLGALYQRIHQDATGAINTNYYGVPTYGDLKQSFLPNSGTFRAENSLFTANVDFHFGWADLKSVSGYGLSIYNQSSDSSLGFKSPPYNLPASVLINIFETRKFTQEFRLSSAGAQKLEWLVGTFYTHEASPVTQDISGVDPTTGAILQTPLTVYFPTTYEEYAVFGDATYHFTDPFSIQAGVRYSRNRQTYYEADSGSVGEIAPGVPFTTSQDSKDDATTFLVVPQYKITPDMMAYLRIASGYRPGGPNPDAVLFNLPGIFGADKTLNYELGLKGDALDKAFTYDLSVFYIDWHNIQLSVTDPVSQFSFFTNGGSARSTGLETALQYRLAQGLRLSANFSYDVAELSSNPPPGFNATNGEQLPISPRYSGSVSADQDFPIMGDWKGFFGATVSYVGKRFGDFPSSATGVRVGLPSYTAVDLRLGARTGPWTIDLSARNISNERGELTRRSLSGRARLTSPYITNFIQPRTIGLSVAKSF
jgi:iron complex outermembrane receptor protein